MSKMTKKEKQSIIAKMAGVQPPKKKRARRKRANRLGGPVIPASNAPRRNGQGRRKGQKRQRGGAVTTAGNTRNFTIPIDEDVGTITGSTGYALTTVSLNPGNPAMLPFVSRVAQNYERYEFKNLRFEYRPSASVFATVGSQGLVGIAATMDAVQVPPSTQAQADVLYHSPIVETARPTGLSLPKSFLQCKSAREKFFVRQSGFIPGGTDPHTYDCGQIFIWTNGQANNNPIGTFRVVGSCELSNPSSDLSTGFPPNFNVALFTVTNGAVRTTGTLGQVPFDTVVTNNLGIVLTNIAQPTAFFTLPAGNWNVDFVGDIDLGGAPTTESLIFTTAIVVANGPPGFTPSPPLSNTCPGPLATNATALHAMSSQSWFVPSNGTTTVQVNYTATYPSGAPNIDASIRFTAI